MRLPRSQSTRKRIDALISGKEGRGERSELVKLAAELLIEEALEGEVDELLGREYYARCGGSGYRNDYRRGKLATAEGRLNYAVPQVRGIEGWRSAVRSTLGGRKHICLYIASAAINGLVQQLDKIVVRFALTIYPYSLGSVELNLLDL